MTRTRKARTRQPTKKKGATKEATPPSSEASESMGSTAPPEQPSPEKESKVSESVDERTEEASKSRKRKENGSSVSGEGQEDTVERGSVPKKTKLEPSTDQDQQTTEPRVEEGNADDDDDAPEAISLAESKKEAIEKLKDESEQVQRVRDEVKEWRRQKVQQFKVQKEDKRMRELVKFPEDDLKAVAKATAQREEIQQLKQKEKRKVRTRPEKPSEKVFECPVGEIKVVSLSDDSKQSVSSTYEAAHQFLNKQLYGRRHKRVPSLTMSARTFTSQPAENFTQR